MSQPDVAVVIPCHNGAEYLDGAIASALSQSHAPSRVFVVDDASTDQSSEVAESYRAKGYPVHCLRLERNGGPATARNAALAQITEPFVAFLDADDRWTENHCESLLMLLLQYPDADLAFARTRSTDPELLDSALPVPAGQPIRMLECLLDDSCISQSAVLARRNSILAAGAYTDGMRYSEDYDLWLRMAHEQLFIASESASCIRTCHAAQASRGAANMYRGAWQARARYFAFAARPGGEQPSAKYATICARAYERDLAGAWRSRSLTLLRSVLGLAYLVPGGSHISRRWVWRAVLLWPVWRLAAFCWDTLPKSWRQSLNAARKTRNARGVRTK